MKFGTFNLLGKENLKEQKNYKREKNYQLRLRKHFKGNPHSVSKGMKVNGLTRELNTLGTMNNATRLR